MGQMRVMEHSLALKNVMHLEFTRVSQCIPPFTWDRHSTCWTALTAEDKLPPASGLGDSTIRLVISLLLLYVQQAPLDRAMLSVKQALALLPKLLDPANELARCVLWTMFMCVAFLVWIVSTDR